MLRSELITQLKGSLFILPGVLHAPSREVPGGVRYRWVTTEPSRWVRTEPPQPHLGTSGTLGTFTHRFPASPTHVCGLAWGHEASPEPPAASPAGTVSLSPPVLGPRAPPTPTIAQKLKLPQIHRERGRDVPGAAPTRPAPALAARRGHRSRGATELKITRPPARGYF